jgi:RNA polymerase I-specific transcription initiation factor RRN5
MKSCRETRACREVMRKVFSWKVRTGMGRLGVEYAFSVFTSSPFFSFTTHHDVFRCTQFSAGIHPASEACWGCTPAMSDSEYDSQPSTDSNEDAGRRSRRASQLPSSPRKRRRSTEILPDPKRRLKVPYNDRYRLLYNEEVAAAVARFDSDPPLHPHSGAQIGASIWTREEKGMFFAALTRLGKDDSVGIASAVKTKSIPEVRKFTLLLQQAAQKVDLHGDAKATLRDIPAAIEIGSDCNARLELTSDSLAMAQERFEAKVERERHGEHWLITPEIAQEIESAVTPSRAASTASSPPPAPDDEQRPNSSDVHMTDPPILRNIPEAKLLIPSAMLELSMSLFMNGSDIPPSSQPHWSTVESEFTSEPSIYRTAFNDFHNLVLSLTKRLMQASLIQATSRVRSLGNQHQHGVQLFVKRRDVHTAADILHLPRDGHNRWQTVARRCGLRVFDYKKKRENLWQGEKYLSWDEVEGLMGERSTRRSSSADGTTLNAAPVSYDEEFKIRAGRSGTPLPQELVTTSDIETDGGAERDWEQEDLTLNSLADDQSSQTSALNDRAPLKHEQGTAEYEKMTLEEFDREASRQEELKLWEVLGTSPPIQKPASLQRGDESESDVELPFGGDDWRDWTRYRAEWEEFDAPVSAAAFRTNRIVHDPSAPLNKGDQLASDVDMESGREGKKRKKRNATEIPIRGARAYAALQDRIATPEDWDPTSVDTDEDVNFPAPSIENIGTHAVVLRADDTDDDDADSVSDNEDN